MVSQEERVFRISNRLRLVRWFGLLLLFLVTFFFPYMIATIGGMYPDLSVAPVFCTILGFLWIPLLAVYWQQTLSIQLEENHFAIRKWLQTPKSFGYSGILAHNERRDFGKGDAFDVLTIYLDDDYFVIKSNEYQEYELLKDHFCQYGKSVPYHKVLTLAERNRLRWMIVGLALLLIANIVFGYLAHNSVDKNPARLTAVTNIVYKVSADQGKGGFKGFIFRLRAWPDFTFYVSRRSYDVDIRSLKQAIMVNQPVTLLIRESDLRKKLLKTEPLTFGDKYNDYNKIIVFGVDQGNSVHVQSAQTVYEPTHTNPRQRLFLLGFLLLLCWVGWVYVDRHKVLRTAS